MPYLLLEICFVFFNAQIAKLRHKKQNKSRTINMTQCNQPQYITTNQRKQHKKINSHSNTQTHTLTSLSKMFVHIVSHALFIWILFKKGAYLIVFFYLVLCFRNAHILGFLSICVFFCLSVCICLAIVLSFIFSPCFINYLKFVFSYCIHLCMFMYVMCNC